MTEQYFKILGIAPTKDETIIKKAYRKKAKEYHPDRNPNDQHAHEKFIAVSEAYEILIELINAPYKTKTHQKTSHASPSNLEVQKAKLAEERLRRAKMRYAYMKQQEALENEKFYRNISRGPFYSYFLVVVFACSMLSITFLLDHYVLPTKWEATKAYKMNSAHYFSGIRYNKIAPVKTKCNEKLWVDIYKLKTLKQDQTIYLEKTYVLSDIKSVLFWNYDEWIESKTDFSVSGTMPLVPIILLIPLLTCFIKGRNFAYSLLFILSSSAFVLLLIFLLISNDRWSAFSLL